MHNKIIIIFLRSEISNKMKKECKRETKMIKKMASSLDTDFKRKFRMKNLLNSRRILGSKDSLVFQLLSLSVHGHKIGWKTQIGKCQLLGLVMDPPD